MSTTIFNAIWYDPAKCEAKAIAAGWDPKSDHGFLDTYAPEEDPDGADSKPFAKLDDAVKFLRALVKRGGDFWGQAEIAEIEIGGRRCQYCICRGKRVVRTYSVDQNGVAAKADVNNCADDDDD